MLTVCGTLYYDGLKLRALKSHTRAPIMLSETEAIGENIGLVARVRDAAARETEFHPLMCRKMNRSILPAYPP